MSLKDYGPFKEIPDAPEVDAEWKLMRIQELLAAAVVLAGSLPEEGDLGHKFRQVRNFIVETAGQVTQAEWHLGLAQLDMR
jgi:hypothetical protein